MQNEGEVNEAKQMIVFVAAPQLNKDKLRFFLLLQKGTICRRFL